MKYILFVAIFTCVSMIVRPMIRKIMKRGN
jgi:hypothetical protein